MSRSPKKTLVIGASQNPARYSFLAINMLKQYLHEIEAIGLREGNVNGTAIKTGRPDLESIDTVTLYIGPRHQPEYYSYIIKLKPKRVIFNPGTENEEFENLLHKEGIETLEACTLVMLRSGLY